jgi:hypothetical protein
MSLKKKEKYWVVLDSISKIQSQPLTDEQLQSSVMRMHEKDWDRFFIWTESWEKWQPLRAFIKTNDKNFLNILNLTKKNEAKEEITITKSMTYVRADNEATSTSYRPEKGHGQDITMDQIKVTHDKPPEELSFKKLNDKEAYNNRSTRHDLKIEILLISKLGKTFRSYSRNISLTGSLLEDNAPFDYYGEIFDVVVVNRYAKDATYSRVQVKGITVGDGVSRRIQFESMNEHTKMRLTALLNEYLENQKNVAKKKAS